MMMHGNICFLQRNDKYQDVHQGEEYPMVLQAFQKRLSQLEKILSGRLLKLLGAMDPEKMMTITRFERLDIKRRRLLNGTLWSKHHSTHQIPIPKPEKGLHIYTFCRKT